MPSRANAGGHVLLQRCCLDCLRGPQHAGWSVGPRAEDRKGTATPSPLLPLAGTGGRISISAVLQFNERVHTGSCSRYQTKFEAFPPLPLFCCLCSFFFFPLSSPLSPPSQCYPHPLRLFGCRKVTSRTTKAPMTTTTSVRRTNRRTGTGSRVNANPQALSFMRHAFRTRPMLQRNNMLER